MSQGQDRPTNSSLTMNDLEDIAEMVTMTKLLAMKLMVAHNNKSLTRPEDCNFSLRLQKFAQTLQEVGKFYENN